MCIAILRPVCTFHFVHFSIHTIPYSVLYWCAFSIFGLFSHKLGNFSQFKVLYSSFYVSICMGNM